MVAMMGGDAERGGPEGMGGHGGNPKAGQPSTFIDVELMDALSDPLRIRVFAVLCEQSASVVEVAGILGERDNNVRHRVRDLEALGWVEPENEDVRGTKFRAVRRVVLPPGVWDRLPEAARQQVAVTIMRQLYADSRASMEAGLFVRLGAHLTLTPMVVDTQGQRDTKDLLEATLDALTVIQGESAKRMGGGGRGNGQATSLTVALAGFESLRTASDAVGAAQSMRL